jgi:signal transduction histidine kinase
MSDAPTWTNHMLQRLPQPIRDRIPEYSCALLALAFGGLGWVVWEYRDTVERVTHTVEVEAAIFEVFARVQDAESGARGYIINGDEVYLKHFTLAENTLEATITKLAVLTADNAEQRTSVGELRPAILERFAKLNAAIKLRRASATANVVPTFGSGSGFVDMERIRGLVVKMKKVEADLYTTRVARVRTMTTVGVLLGLINLALVIAAMSVWVSNTRREARQLIVAAVERDQNETKIRQMQKIEAVGQLTGGLAHDLNNMLAVIISGLNLLQKRVAAGNSDVQKFIDAAMDGATRAATLTNRLMAFSRQLPLAPQPIDANKLVGGMSDLIQRTLGETIRTQTVLTAGVWRTNADAGQLENALLNLAINARDAMPDGGRLTLETSNATLDQAYGREYDMPPGDYVLTSVTDTGTGMTAEVISKAFEPFFTTKGVGKGTGLGLSQVFGFIKQSGGHVKIYSELGHGTTIKMYLPRLFDDGPEHAIRTAEAEAWPDLSPGIRSANAARLILVVEDDARVNEMTVSALRELGYTVIHANGATSALSKLDAHPDTTLLFTDIVMPDINGRQLAAEALRRRPDLKVLYTTGFTRNAIVHSGKLDAGLHFLAKPFTLVQLDSKMREVMA